MATGVNYWSFNEPSYKVREWVLEGEQASSGEEGGGGVTWETQDMEVKGQLIRAPDPLTCSDRKQRERMAELQERRRSLQALLSTRLAELRRVCLQEAELTGTVPNDFPLEAGEKPPCVRRRGGAPRHANRKCRAEEEESQRAKPKKTLFSAALRKHSDSEHGAHTHTLTHHGKRTVHRGCHTDDTVRSESSSTSDSTGQENDEGLSQCRPPLVTAGSPVEVFYQNKPRRNSVLNRSDHLETLPPHKLLPLPPSHPPPPPPRSQDSSSSSAPSDPAAEGVVRINAARHSNSSDGLLDRVAHPEEEGGAQQGGLWVNGLQGSRGTSTGGVFRSSETLADGRSQTNSGSSTEGGGAGRGRGAGRGAGGYSEVLLDYVWGKQQQSRTSQQPNSRQPITSHQQLLFNGFSSQQPPVAPPTYRGHQGDQRRVKVTRTKSCGPFLPVNGDQTETHNPPVTAIQPDPHPHLLPPRPPQLPPNQDAQLEDATRSLHKALALEGLRDWYLRNTIGTSNEKQVNGKGASRVNTKAKEGVKGQSGGGGGAFPDRHIQPSTCHSGTRHHKKSLPHSATFHGHPLHGRSVDSSLYHGSFPPQKQEVPLRDLTLDQPSPGTLV